LIEKILDVQRYEAPPVGEAVAETRVEGPKGVLVGNEISVPIEVTDVLVDIGGGEAGEEPGWVEEAGAEWHLVRDEFDCSGRVSSQPVEIEPLEPVLGAQRDPGRWCRVKVGAGEPLPLIDVLDPFGGLDEARGHLQVPLRDSDDALLVNWCELTTTTESGQVVYTNAWATSHLITDDTIGSLVTAGRSRWKIENENNNVLKTKGYHFEHNYGHGQQHLSALLASLILLAYLIHTVLDWMDERYRTVRAILPSRRTFFEHLRALLQYLPFDNWDQLMSFMLQGLEPTPIDSG
jgi:hypothetical protein